MKLIIILSFLLVSHFELVLSTSLNQPGNSVSISQAQSQQVACQSGNKIYINQDIFSTPYGLCDNLICDQGFIQIESQCVQHPDLNCSKGGFSADGSAIVCFQRKLQTQIAGGVCIQKNQCQVINAQLGLCQQCVQGYFLTNSPYQQNISDFQQMNYCEQCPEGCSSCNNQYQCTSCISSYGQQINIKKNFCQKSEIGCNFQSLLFHGRMSF